MRRFHFDLRRLLNNYLKKSNVRKECKRKVSRVKVRTKTQRRKGEIMKQKKMESESEEIGFNRKNGFSKEKSR